MSDSNLLKNDIDRICKKLAEKGEESVFITVNLEQTTCFVMGSEIGLRWLDMQSAVVQRFYHYCSDHVQPKIVKHKHEKKQLNSDNTEFKDIPKVNIPGPQPVNSGQLLKDNPVSLPKPDELIETDTKVFQQDSLASGQNVQNNLSGLAMQSVSKPSPCQPTKSDVECQSDPKIFHENSCMLATKNVPQMRTQDNPSHNSVPTSATVQSKVSMVTKSQARGGAEVLLPTSQQLQEKSSTTENLKAKTIDERRKLFTKLKFTPSGPAKVVANSESKIKLENTENPQEISRTLKRKAQKTKNEPSEHVQESNKAKTRRVESEQTTKTDTDDNKETPLASRRTRRTPKPRKLHQMECYVKLTSIDGMSVKDLINNAITDDPTFNRSEVDNDPLDDNSGGNLDGLDSSTLERQNGSDSAVESNGLNLQNVKQEENSSEKFEPFLIHPEESQSDHDLDEVEGVDDDYDVEDDAKDEDEDEDEPESSSSKKKTKIQKMGMDVVLSNHLNNIRSRIKRSRKRGHGDIACATCDLTFNSWRGYKRHANACQIIKCPRCEKQFKSLEELQQHVETHTNEELHKCQYCEKEFMLITMLKRHETSHRVNKKFPCPKCSKTFFTVTFVRTHLRDIHKDTRPVCIDCGKFFNNEFEYNEHIGVHDNKRIGGFQCRKCGKMFELLYYLKRHNRHFHKAKGEKICHLCLGYFPQETFQEHLKEHEWDKPNTCNRCRESFKTKELLDEHIFQVHNMGMIYMCDVCGFNASSGLALKHHKMEHDDSMPHTCNVCKKGFPLAIQLKSHMFNHETKKQFICETCGKAFKRRTTLRSHSIVHTDGIKCKFCDRQFRSVGGVNYHIVRCHADQVNLENYRRKLVKCEECDKYFPSQTSYAQHKVKHTSERSWTCPVCKKQFKTQKQMKEHATNHVQNKPYYCTKCERGFSSKPRWEAHLRTDKHKTQSVKSDEVLRQEKNLKIKVQEQRLNQKNSTMTEDAPNEVVKTYEITTNTTDGVTDLPETTIFIIDDNGTVEYITEDGSATGGVTFIQTVPTDSAATVQEVVTSEIQNLQTTN